MKRKKTKSFNVLQVIGIIILFASSMTFFISYGSIVPNAFPLLQVGEPLPEKQNVSIVYFVKLSDEIINLNSPNTVTYHTLDVTYTLLGILIGLSITITSRFGRR